MIALLGMAGFVLLALADHFVVSNYLPSGFSLRLLQLVCLVGVAFLIRKEVKDREKEK
ncbi:hypothetical protein [Actinopolyspora alba]|uniref:hypothetical protein n=1 Tax=Actinopolyspora alba TaxID=673379 RepID=UPI0015879F6B|nr:hypothetical protein [Actinopolyspora alba]